MQVLARAELQPYYFDIMSSATESTALRRICPGCEQELSKSAYYRHQNYPATCAGKRQRTSVCSDCHSDCTSTQVPDCMATGTCEKNESRGPRAEDQAEIDCSDCSSIGDMDDDGHEEACECGTEVNN